MSDCLGDAASHILKVLTLHVNSELLGLTSNDALCFPWRRQMKQYQSIEGPLLKI